MKLRFSDRLWIAWRILRSDLRAYRADADSLRVTLDFGIRNRMKLNARVNAAENRARPESRTFGS